MSKCEMWRGRGEQIRDAACKSRCGSRGLWDSCGCARGLAWGYIRMTCFMGDIRVIYAMDGVRMVYYRVVKLCADAFD